MATVREGSRNVLLVVDVQVAVMQSAWQAERVIGRVAQAVARAREAGVPVLWVQHASEDLAPGSAGWQWVPALVPAADEPLIPKQFNSAFEQTTLEATLAQLGASQITLAGAASNWCIRATAYAALERGYDLTLLDDAHTTEDLNLDHGRCVQAEQVVADLNAAMTWLRYPGRSCRTASAATAEF